MRSALTAVIVAVLIATPPARADSDANGRYPGQHTANVPVLDRIVKRGLAWWAHRGVNVTAICPAGIRVEVASDLDDDDVVGTVVGRGAVCRIVLLDRQVRQMVREIRRHHDRVWIRAGIEGVCETAWHEVGHALWLTHSSFRRPVQYVDALQPRAPIADREAILLMDSLEVDHEHIVYTPRACVRLSAILTRPSYRRLLRYRRSPAA
jgi:hypothetical protein